MGPPTRPVKVRAPRPEIKVATAVAKLLAQYFDVQEVVEIFSDIKEVMVNENLTREQKIKKILWILAQEGLEDIIVSWLKPKSPWHGTLKMEFMRG